ncbi:MAG: hypothetical protein KAW12_13970 [Candidatus Aminicenantes bacterium]|nr:hypothetical protein [Candidatus Aminicenantes bacterium]
MVKMIRGRSHFFNGNWEIELRSSSMEKYKYKLNTTAGKVSYEEIEIANKIVLQREKEEGEIYSYTKNKRIKINPPIEELTLHVRRDVKEFPFLEDILKWAKNFKGYTFSTADPGGLTITPKTEALLERNGHIVNSYSYSNSRELFDRFEFTGLNNFDFFTGGSYKEQTES